MTDRKKAHVLISYYVKKYKETYNSAPVINRNRLRWGFEDMIEDLTLSKAMEVIDWYFRVMQSHDPWNLLNSYDKFVRMIEEDEADREYREKLRRRTEERVEEFRKKREIERARIQGISGGIEE